MPLAELEKEKLDKFNLHFLTVGPGESERPRTLQITPLDTQYAQTKNPGEASASKKIDYAGAFGFAPDSAFTYVAVGAGAFVAGMLCARQPALAKMVNVMENSTRSSAGAEILPTLKIIENIESRIVKDVLESHGSQLSTEIRHIGLSSPALPLKSEKVELTPLGLKTDFGAGRSTLTDLNGRHWLHHEGYARVPIDGKINIWWQDDNPNITWVKTKHYLENRNDEGSYYRTYHNGAVQIRLGDGREFYESAFPERKKIWISKG